MAKVKGESDIKRGFLAFPQLVQVEEQTKKMVTLLPSHVMAALEPQKFFSLGPTEIIPLLGTLPA
jgi:hypothetical protein